MQTYKTAKFPVAISIHSLVKRETVDKYAHLCYNLNFNPLPRKEGDNIAIINTSILFLFQSTPS